MLLVVSPERVLDGDVGFRAAAHDQGTGDGKGEFLVVGRAGDRHLGRFPAIRACSQMTANCPGHMPQVQVENEDEHHFEGVEDGSRHSDHPVDEVGLTESEDVTV